MPTYEYECTKCGRLFEVLQSMSDKPKRTVACDCKKCKNKAPVVRRISGGAGLIFKGSGFYITDYRSENYKKDAKADTDIKTEKADKTDKPAKEGESTPKTTEPAKTEKKPKPETKASKKSKRD